MLRGGKKKSCSSVITNHPRDGALLPPPEARGEKSGVWLVASACESVTRGTRSPVGGLLSRCGWRGPSRIGPRVVELGQKSAKTKESGCYRWVPSYLFTLADGLRPPCSKIDVGRAPLSSTIFLTFLQIKENAKTHTWISNFSKKNAINAVVRRIHQTGKKR
jgi:hypothetical protein